MGSQFVDLTGTPTPLQLATSPSEQTDVWIRKGDLLCGIHRNARTKLFMPDPQDPALKGLSLENWRKTIRSDTKEVVVHHRWSDEASREAPWGETPWKGESQFQVRAKREVPASSPAEGSVHAPAVPAQASPSTGTTTDAVSPVESNPQELTQQRHASPIPVRPSNRWSPIADDQISKEPEPAGYGPVRLRQHEKGPPMFLLCPEETQIEDMRDILSEQHGTKRSLSPEGQPSAPSKLSKTEGDDECLLAELARENGPAPCVEVLIAI